MNESITSSSTAEDPKFSLFRAKFIILIFLQIPAILLTVVIFIFFIIHRATLEKLQNQSTLILLIANFIRLLTTMSMPIDFYRRGYVSPSTSIYCTLWTFGEYSLAVIGEYLMASISIQRHAFIFHPNLFRTPFKSFLFFYAPLVFNVAYPTTFYLYAIILYPCQSQWDYTSTVCGYMNCYYDNKILGLFDWVVNNIVPIVFIIIANVTIIVRVVVGKRRRNQVVSWRQQRYMTIQLFNISSLFVIAWSPSIVIGLIQQATSTSLFVDIQLNYVMELIYLACLLLPWACMSLLPEFRKWIWKYFDRARIGHSTIVP
ncbi:unnamed protein product [Adineta ricciae]|uniref:G-protein coupled receptors family 1 profile domain-containing protein n=3 Tax=Adineta ricciae TaxID=249248 RepID=A0A815GKU9_ADIRI|nr:unnamed protein product [Adineta ricciae]